MVCSKIFLLFVILLSNPTDLTRLEAEEMKIISLSEPKLKGGLSLEEAINLRRSKRNFVEKDLTLDQISQLLWACQGITDKRRGLRAAPSAGATYPLEIYLLNREGLFHYIPNGHRLEKILDKDIRQELCNAALGQSPIRDAPVDIVICAIFERTTSVYGRRAQAYVFIEAGHAAENIHLQAVSLGLGSVPIGAFDDDFVRDVLKLKDPTRPIYIIPVGYTRE